MSAVPRPRALPRKRADAAPRAVRRMRRRGVDVPMPDARERLEAWFAARGWAVQAFQREVWDAWAAGRSGLLHAPTGSGKTLAVWGAALLHAVGGGDRGVGFDRLTPNGDRESAEPKSVRGEPVESAALVPASPVHGEPVQSAAPVPASPVHGEPVESAAPVPASPVHGEPVESAAPVPTAHRLKFLWITPLRALAADT